MTAVHLKTDDSVFAGLGAIVDHLGSDQAVDAVSDVVAISDDNGVVPFSDWLDHGFDFGVSLIEWCAGALVLRIPDSLFAAFAHDAATASDAAFVIDDTGVAIACIDICLVTSDVEHLGLVDLASDLQARVAAGSDPFEFVADFEVGEFLRIVFRAE